MYGCPTTRLCRVVIETLVEDGLLRDASEALYVDNANDTRATRTPHSPRHCLHGHGIVGLLKVCCCRSPSRVGYLEFRDPIGMDGEAEAKADRK